MTATFSDEARRLFARATTASLTAQLIKRGFRNRAIAHVTAVNPATPRLWGPAYTVRYIPAREDLATGAAMGDPANPQRHAIEATPPGHVIIVDTHGLDSSGTFGDILVARLRVRGVAGIVSDGPMRDVAELSRMDFPVFARGNAAPPSYGSMMAVDAQVPTASWCCLPRSRKRLPGTPSSRTGSRRTSGNVSKAVTVSWVCIRRARR
jgi:regulator of RNase E activity RraA